MDDHAKLYLFTKVEMALVFFFALILICMAFLFGFKVGRSHSFEEAGLKPEDQKSLELFSKREEEVHQAVKDQEKSVSLGEEILESKDLSQKLEEKIKAEFASEIKKENVEKRDEATVEMREIQKESVEKEERPVSPLVGVSNIKDEVDIKGGRRGKYTVQVGSHRSFKEARAFAEGFRIRDYEPIINEVELPNRGTWYRVSLGIFDTVLEAKEFVKRENSLFQGQDYVFVRFE